VHRWVKEARVSLNRPCADFEITRENLERLREFCDELLVHGVDVEGRRCGIDENLVELLADACPVPVTYAGGVRSTEDVRLVHRLGRGAIHVSIGSALDLFGGSLSVDGVVACVRELNRLGEA
jgi:phosphoribosylformimino-5-aminoimidazole carboxamide ribotide isomerase